MNSGKHISTIRNLEAIAWFTLLLLNILVLIFALFSGSEAAGLLKNSLNTLPWVGLLVATVYSWKKPVFGGLILILLGLALVYFFNFTGTNFFLVTFMVTLIIPVLGFIILFCGYYLDNVEKWNPETE